jgi:hypothetical protein
MFIYKVPAFQRIFDYLEEVRAKADETVTTILEHPGSQSESDNTIVRRSAVD